MNKCEFQDRFTTHSHPNGDVTLLVVEIERLEKILAAVTHWLEKNQPDVFARGILDSFAQIKAEKRLEVYKNYQEET